MLTGRVSTMDDVGAWDRVGAVRRARRVAGLSQREMADRAGLARSTVARAECPDGAVSLEAVTAILAVAGLRLAVVDARGELVQPMGAHPVRDGAGRYFPAHLDTVPPGDLTPAGHQWSYDRPPPEVTFSRGSFRGALRERPGLHRPEDHVTAEELPGLRAQQKAARRARLPQRTPRELPECACGPECERDCVDACTCQCEPPGIELGPLYLPAVPDRPARAVPEAEPPPGTAPCRAVWPV